MRRDPLLGFEQHLYLRQPGYGASYITGGRLMEEIVAERARQLGDGFSVQRVMDEINGAGMIPPSGKASVSISSGGRLKPPPRPPPRPCPCP